MTSDQVSRLRALASQNAAARSLFREYAGRQRNRKEVRFNFLIGRLLDVDAPELRAVLRQLEEMGVGFYIEGRKGKPSRFRWSESSLHVSKMALDGRDSEGNSEGGGEVVTAEKAEPNDGDGAYELSAITHIFAVRPDFIVQLRLPANFTERESERLSSFIRTLPFHSDSSP